MHNLEQLVFLGVAFVILLAAIGYVGLCCWYKYRWLPRYERKISRERAKYTSGGLRS